MARKSGKLRVGVVGAGGIAGAQIERLRKAKRDDWEVVAAADIHAGRLAEFADKWGIPKRVADWKKLVADPGVDAVTVCTPNKLHCAPAVAAARAGKHVMVEKPMAMNAAECAQMCAAARKAGTVMQIGFQQRFNAASQFLRRVVAEGGLGKILYVRAQAMRRMGIPSWGVFGRKDLQGGGPLIDIGVHILECAHYIMGRPQPTHASGATHTYLGDRKPEVATHMGDWDWKTYTVEDLATGYIRFAGGATLTLESSFAAHIEKDAWNITIMGTKGGATLDPLTLFTHRHGAMTNETPTHVGFQDGFDFKMKHWLEVIQDGAKSDAPGEDGLMVQQMLDGLYASADAGREMAIKPMIPAKGAKR
jgi:predicted dehydrogenase